MNDDIFPVTPRITDPDLRPSQYGAERQYGSRQQTSEYGSSHNDGSLIEFEQQEPQSPSIKPQRGANTRDDRRSMNDGDPPKATGFNILGFNLTYKHIIIIVLVVIALLIVIYLVVNWMRKGSNTGEGLAANAQGGGTGTPPHGNAGQRGGYQGQQAQHGQQMQQRNPIPGGVGGHRSHPDAGKSASELDALLKQSQNKLNELNAGEQRVDQGQNTGQASDNTTAQEQRSDNSEEDNNVEPHNNSVDISTHMEIPQEQIDNILSTGDEE